MKYLLYGRVSPRGSSWSCGETSIPDQIAECRAYALAVDPAATFVVVEDEFWSAGTAKRPGYQRILTDLAVGSDWDVLVVRHLDRLSRALVDAVDLFEQLKAAGKGLISITQRIDMSSPTGRAMLHIICIFGQWEREMASERTRMKMMSIAAAGGWPVGTVAIGYRRPGKGQNVLEIDPVGAQTVRALFGRYVAGDPISDIARDLSLSGRSQAFAMLRNKIYVGVIEYGGEVFQGKHPAIIQQELWDAAQVRQEGGERVLEGSRRVSLLKGVLRCKCGRYLTPASARGRGGVRYDYYQCTDMDCRVRVRAREIEALVVRQLGGFSLRARDVAALKSRAREFFRARAQYSDDDLREAHAAEAQACRRHAKIKRLFLSGVVSDDNAAEFNADLTAAREEMYRFRGRVAALEQMASPEQAALDQIDHFLDRAAELRGGLAASDDTHIVRAVITAFVSSVTMMGTGEWDVALKDPPPGSSTSTSARQSGFDEPGEWTLPVLRITPRQVRMVAGC